MKSLSPEAQEQLHAHLTAVAEILYSHTEADKLQDFESIEWELREQLLQHVAPRLGEFFSPQVDLIAVVSNAVSKVVLEKSAFAKKTGSA